MIDTSGARRACLHNLGNDMQYTKAELIEIRNALSDRVSELVKQNQYGAAANLAELRDKVQRDIDTRVN